MKWKELNSKIAYKNHFFKIHEKKMEMPDGKIVPNFYTLEQAKAVTVVAITEKNEIILVKQYRVPIDNLSLEAPAGFLEKGESKLDAAKRELQEETGYTSNNWAYLGGSYPSIGILTTESLFFLALDAKQNKEQNLDEHEDINVEKIKLKKIDKLIAEGKIQSSSSILGILLTKPYFQIKNLTKLLKSYWLTTLIAGITIFLSYLTFQTDSLLLLGFYYSYIAIGILYPIGLILNLYLIVKYKSYKLKEKKALLKPIIIYTILFNANLALCYLFMNIALNFY